MCVCVCARLLNCASNRWSINKLAPSKFESDKMSQQQQQTVRITTTETTTTTPLVINSGYLKTPPGLLKVIQFVNILLCFANYPLTVCRRPTLTALWSAFPFPICALLLRHRHRRGHSRSWDACALGSLPIISMIATCPPRPSYSSTWWAWHFWCARAFCWSPAWFRGARAASFRKPFM